MRKGNGGSGPESGPTIVGRGARGAASWDILYAIGGLEGSGYLLAVLEGQFAI